MFLRLLRVFALFALAPGLAGPAWAEVYKCADASGRVTYSDIACPQPQEPGAIVTGGATLRSSPTEQSKATTGKPCGRAHPSGARDVLKSCRQQPDELSSFRR